MRIETINNWKPEIRSLLLRLKTNGFTLVSAHNGEEKVTNSRIEPLVECLVATDEGWLTCTKDGQRYRLFLVLGNSPGELVADYTYPELTDGMALEVVTQEHYDKWETRKQPQLTGYYGLKDGRYQFIEATELPKEEVAS